MHQRATALTFTLALALGSGAQAALVASTPVFFDNFEAGLGAWTDRTPGNPQAAILTDPLNAANHVLGFSRLGSAGSIFSTALVTSSGSFTLSFDHLGAAMAGGVAGDRGGYIGVSQDLPGNHQWLGGTGAYATPLNLVDDGSWHHYSFTFHSAVGQSVHLMLEDWDGSGGIAGDALFDNLRLSDTSLAAASAVPEPASLGLLGLALGACGLASRRRRA